VSDVDSPPNARCRGNLDGHVAAHARIVSTIDFAHVP
jgi:hypothetical protein